MSLGLLSSLSDSSGLRGRCDLDVLARCGLVYVIASLAYCALSWLPPCLGLWLARETFERWTTVALLAAFLKSAFVVEARGKAVLVTGQK